MKKLIIVGLLMIFLVPTVLAQLSVEPLPNVTRERFVDIIGVTEPGATVRFFIGGNTIPEFIRNVGAFSMVAQPDGSFIGNIELSSAIYKGTLGLNEIKVEVNHLDNSRENTIISTIFDRTPPALFVNDIQTPRQTGLIPLVGTTSDNAVVTYQINTQREFEVGVINNEFNETINLGGDGTYNLTIRAEDVAGNIATHFVRIVVDSTPCRLDTSYEPFNDLFREEQRFSVVKIKGKTTEPNCEVLVINSGEIAEINISDVLDWGITVRQFLEEFEVGIGGLAVGRVKQVKSDANGEFGATISLTTGIIEEDYPEYPLPIVGSGINNIQFIIRDSAGNVHNEVQTLIYDPGSGSWHVSNIQTIPNTLYTDELFDEDAPGYTRFSIIYDLKYFGPTSEEVVNPSVSVSVTNSYDGEHVSIVDTFQRWNPDERKLVVVATGEFSANSKDIDELRGKLSGNEILDLGTGLQADFELSNIITYNYGQYSLSEEAFVRHAIGVETPFDYNKILKPEIIGDAIDFLDDIIEVLDTAEGIAQKVADVTLVGCLATTVFSWLGGPENLRTTYMVCDRIWCPTIPPDCGEFKLKEVGGEKIWESTRKGATTQIAFLGRDRASSTISGAINCPVGFNAIARYTYNSTGGLGIRAVGQEITGVGATVTYECVPINRTTWDAAEDIVALGVGCYKEGLPQYDETKCLFANGDSINNDGEVNTYDNFFDSVQCGCISGVRGHLANYLKVTNAMKKCLQSAQVGKVSGAYCEELFLQFACDLVTDVFRSALGGSKKEFSSGEGNVARGSFEEVNDRLAARYGNIIENRYGLNTKDIVHKACVGAVTGDLSDISDIFRRVTRIPVKPIIGPMFPETRFNAWNPLTGEASIVYHSTLGIISGGQDIEYNYKILCDPNAENGGFCKPGEVVTIYERAGVVLGDDVLQEKVFYVDNEARTWGNVAVLEYEYTLGNQLIREVQRETFGRKSPFLAQCSFDAFPVFFGIRCKSFGVEGLQPIEFKSASLTPSGVSRYYPQNSVFIKTEIDIGLFGKGLEGVTGGAVSEEIDLIFVSNITKPDGSELFKYNKVNLSKNVQAFELLKIEEEARAEGGPSEGDYIFYGRGIRFGDFKGTFSGKQIVMKSGDIIIVEAYHEDKNKIITGRKINNFELEAKEEGVEDILCSEREKRKLCVFNNDETDAKFTINKINYEIDAENNKDTIFIKIVHQDKEGKVKEFVSNELIKPRLSTRIIERDWPKGKYKVEMSLYQDLDQDGVIDVNDVPVSFGSEVIQKKIVEFDVTLDDPEASPRNCGENPRVEIINPTEDTSVDKNLKYHNGEGVEFVVWDDCLGYKDNKVDVLLYDSKSYDKARVKVSEPSIRGVYPGWSIDNKENTQRSMFILGADVPANKAAFKSIYNDGERFSLIAQVVDNKNKISEDRVNVKFSGFISESELATIEPPKVPEEVVEVSGLFPIEGINNYNGLQTMFSEAGINKWIDWSKEHPGVLNKWFDYSVVIDPVYISKFTGNKFRLYKGLSGIKLYIEKDELSTRYNDKGELEQRNIILGDGDLRYFTDNPSEAEVYNLRSSTLFKIRELLILDRLHPNNVGMRNRWVGVESEIGTKSNKKMFSDASDSLGDVKFMYLSYQLIDNYYYSILYIYNKIDNAIYMYNLNNKITKYRKDWLSKREGYLWFAKDVETNMKRAEVINNLKEILPAVGAQISKTDEWYVPAPVITGSGKYWDSIIVYVNRNRRIRTPPNFEKADAGTPWEDLVSEMLKYSKDSFSLDRTNQILWIDNIIREAEIKQGKSIMIPLPEEFMPKK